jgi:hypothetical protein
MQTLNKRITATFYKDSEGYAAMQANWSCLMRNPEQRKSLTAAHHLLYLILRGKNWQKAFTPMTNAVKIRNGGLSGSGGRRALRQLHSTACMEELLKPFADYLHADTLFAIWKLVPPLEWEADPLAREPYDV